MDFRRVLFRSWLPRVDALAGITVMLQKEVAERLYAPPRRKGYGRLSVMSQWLWRPRRLFDVPRQAFVPPPNVTSAVISLEPLPEPAAPADWEALQTVTAAAFNQRRKMLRSSLKALGPRSEDHTSELQSLMRISYAVFCLKKKTNKNTHKG